MADGGSGFGAWEELKANFTTETQRGVAATKTAVDRQ
jgi:hypothetical protein